MERSKRDPGKPEKPDYSPLIRAVMYLDECLKRGVVIGVYEDSMTVSDEDVQKALTNVRRQIDATITDMERLARAVTRAQQLPGSPILQ